MNILRFITIDTLCIAAEVTAALLLLGFAIPERKKKEDDGSKVRDERDHLHQLLSDCYLQETVQRALNRLQCSKIAENSGGLSREGGKDTARLLGWNDRLTHLFNRSFIDLFLEEWSVVPLSQRHGGCLALLDLNDYSELVQSKGAMAIEGILRETASLLEAAFGDRAIMGRYQPNRFALVTLDDSLATSHEALNRFMEQLESLGKDSGSSLHEVHFSLCISDLAADHSASPEAWIEGLDEGIMQSMESGHRLLSRQGDQWTAEVPAKTANSHPKPPPLRQMASDEQTQNPSELIGASDVQGQSDSTLKVDTSANASDDAAGTVEPTPELQSEATDRTAEEKEPQANSSAPSGSDVSAVASDEDIAALFAQIQNKKAPEQASKKASPTVDPTPSVSPQPNSPPELESLSQDGPESIASADDIAALFAS